MDEAMSGIMNRVREISERGEKFAVALAAKTEVEASKPIKLQYPMVL